MNIRLAAKAVLFTLLMPGMVTILVPCLLPGGSDTVEGTGLSTIRVVAVCTGILGTGIILHCIAGFALHGRGTLAPVAPPEVLVTSGLYRYTRNPMYLGVLTVLSSEALFFEKPALVIYAVFMLACFHLFVVLYEEPRLRKHYGEQYLEYCRAVPRWRVALRPFRDLSA